jgi:hypothetical protein
VHFVVAFCVCCGSAAMLSASAANELCAASKSKLTKIGFEYFIVIVIFS